MERKKLSITEVLLMLDEGKSKDEINTFYELNPREIKALWQHPKLKGKKKAKYSVGIEIVDDTVLVDYGTEMSVNINPNATIVKD